MATRVKRRKDRLTPTQARAARRLRRERRRRFVRFGAFLGVGIIAFLFIVSLFAGSLPISIGSKGPEGPGERFPEQPSTFIEIDDSHPAYNSKPATSGWHYDEPASWGVKNEVVPEERLVHNLRNGGIVIYYDCPEGCDDLVDKLADIVRSTRRAVLAPYPEMETKIALTAWTFIERLEEFDEDRITAFVDAHLDSPNAPNPFAP